MSEPGLRWGAKDPADVLDYAIDWSSVLAELGDDTIASTTWVVPAGLTGGAEAAAGAVRTKFLSGGTADQSYALTCTITTLGGRTISRTVLLDVKEL